jgi:hypothetical protein
LIIEFTDSEIAQLRFVLANAEGKGINWMMVHPLLMKISSSEQRQQGVPGVPGNPAMGLPPTRTDGMRPPFPPVMREPRPTLEVHDE